MVCPRCGACSIREADGGFWCLVHGSFNVCERYRGGLYVSVEDDRGGPEVIRQSRGAAPRQSDTWSANDWAFLRAHLADLSTAEIAEALGRTERGVFEQLRVNGIRKPYRRSRQPERPWTAADLAEVAERVYSEPAHRLSVRLGHRPRLRAELLALLEARGVVPKPSSLPTC